MSQPPLLPPIQGHDSTPHMQQYHQPQLHHYAPHQPAPPPPSMNGAPIHQHHNPLPPPPPNPYIYPESTQAHSQQYSQQQQSALPPNGTTNGQSQIRYALPPQQMDSRQMSGGRQKKEIKRRTKTGCLTCRKRRIKCDEAHPTCRNCQKSKRDCLGYDPIFKAQGLPAPILPAAGAVQQPQQLSSPLATIPQPAYSAPQGYAPASSAGYVPAPAPPVHDPQASYENDYNYGASLDPELSTGQAPPEEATPRTYTTTLLPHRLTKPLSIDLLFLHEDVPATVFPAPDDTFRATDQDLAEMRSMYKEQYARGLDSFFETTWYSTQGEYHLHTNRTTAHFFKYCIDRFKVPPQPHEEYQTMPSLEARLIWQLATLPRRVTSEQMSPLLHDLLPRVSTIEHLLTGTYLPPSWVPAIPSEPNPPLQPDSAAALAHSAYTFWHHLATFTSLDDSVSSPSKPNALTAVSHALASMRHILSMLENRDVLYSVAIARHYGGRTEEYRPDEALVASSQDPEDPINKLVVAFRFLAAEEGAGTTQIVQAFCGMCRRSWSRGRLKTDERFGNEDGNQNRTRSAIGGGNGLGYLKAENMDRNIDVSKADVEMDLGVERTDSGRVDAMNGVGALNQGIGGIKAQ